MGFRASGLGCITWRSWCRHSLPLGVGVKDFGGLGVHDNKPHPTSPGFGGGYWCR